MTQNFERIHVSVSSLNQLKTFNNTKFAIMPFLDFFKKTPKGPIINVRVWANQAEKEQACISMAKTEKTLVFLTWSKVTCEHYQEIFRKRDLPNEVIMANDVLPSRMKERNYVFLERHYDLDKEKKFLESLNASKVLAQVSLSDPLLSFFNGDRIQNVMESMGHKKGEYLEHEMINKSIERAMKKIMNSGVPGDSSQEMKDWIDGIV